MPVHKFGMNSEMRKESSDSISLSYLNKNFQRKADSDDIKSAIDELKANNKQLRNYVEKLQRDANKNYITIWAEEKGGLNNGKYEWSFGDGMTGKMRGYPILTRSKILRMGIAVSNPTGRHEEVVASLVINGSKTNIKIVKPPGKSTHVIYVPDVNLEPEDTINFMSETTTERVGGAVISFLLEIYL